jgi:hypothetical protein
MGTPIEDAVFRGWMNLVHRLDGPLHTRFIVQPAVATLLAVRASVRRAREGDSHGRAVLWSRAARRAWLRRGWSDVGRVFLVAVVLDVVYQVWVERGIYALELLLTATLLALVPYVVVSGVAAAVVRARRGRLGVRTRCKEVVSRHG